jgi:nuclease-like protein
VSLDQYRRTVAVCSIDGVDLAEWLVRNGLALDWPKYSKGKYDGAQRDAEHAGHGIWKGTYVEPWLYRACIRQGGRRGDCSDDANLHPLEKATFQILPNRPEINLRSFPAKRSTGTALSVGVGG